MSFWKAVSISSGQTQGIKMKSCSCLNTIVYKKTEVYRVCVWLENVKEEVLIPNLAPGHSRRPNHDFFVKPE